MIHILERGLVDTLDYVSRLFEVQIDAVSLLPVLMSHCALGQAMTIL
jgi:hypothetical protein